MPKGGFRENSGRKRQVKHFSDRVRKNYQDADRFFSRFLLGEDIRPRKLTPEMATVGLVFGYVWDRGAQTWIKAAVQDTVRASAQKTRQEALVVRENRQTVEHHQLGPRIGLPPIDPKPKTEVLS
jgi:hypothetical protein